MPLEADHPRASHTYVLDPAGKPRREHNQERWIAWMQDNDQPLAESLLAAGVRVSTRFLGMDQRRNKIGAPVLWETMIFGGLHDLHQERYTSQTAALKGHAKAVAFAKNQGN